MKTIPFSRVDCSGNELNYVREVLAGGWLTTGGKVRTFEERFARAVKAKHACAVCSGTAALHLAAEALGIRAGDKVFVPTMTFTASAEILRYLGADPVFLDVDYGTGLLTPEILADAIRKHPRVRHVIVVHYGGQAAAMLEPKGEGILALCRKHGLRVIEDAAHAFPCRHAGKPVGSIGDVTCFSFYANKPVTTAEGGMLTTNDDRIARRARVMRLHGIDRDAWARFGADSAAWEYDVVAPGFKYNMPDLNAAVGLAQLERAEFRRRARQRLAEYYREALADLPGVDLPVLRCPPEDHAWHLFPIVLTPAARVSRNRFIGRMNERGVGTSVHYKPLHRMSYYRKRYGLKPASFPDAERLWKGTVSLPLYAGLGEAEQETVCRRVREILRG